MPRHRRLRVARHPQLAPAHRRHQVGLEQRAAVGHGGGGRGELEGGHRDPLPEGDVGFGQGTPVLHPVEDAGALARQVDPRQPAEAEAADGTVEALVAQPQGRLDDPDVARLGDHLGEGQPAVALVVADVDAEKGDAPHLAVEHVVRLDQAGVEGRRRGDDLERRAGLVDVHDRPVAPLGLVIAAEVVGIERRVAGHGQHAARLRVEEEGAPPLRAPRLDGAHQLALHDVLHGGVERQVEVVSRLGLGEGEAGGDQRAALGIA